VSPVVVLVQENRPQFGGRQASEQHFSAMDPHSERAW
jgi:hypothetical protein